MSETERLLDLLLCRPRAFILLSLLTLLSKKKERNVFSFRVSEVRGIGCRSILTVGQVRDNLDFLKKQGYIEINKSPVGVRSYKEITILNGGL